MKNKLKTIIFLIIIQLIMLLSSSVMADIEDEEDINQNEIKETIETVQTASNLSQEPKLSSRIGLIYDRASGQILYDKNGNKQTPMASTTKIMTAIVVLEKANLSDTVTVSAKAGGTGGSRLGLKKGDKVTVNDLLYGLMLRSGNDAAVALAEHVGGSVSGFAQLMNEKAKELKLINSHFVVPHGLDVEGHYTTAYELAKMADYALNIEKFRQIVSTKICQVSINGNLKTITNTNELLGNLNGVYGVKTGFTNGAGRCLATSCKRADLDIITVVLGADTKKIRTSDSTKLIEHAYKNYEMVDINSRVKEEFEKWKDVNEKRIVINKGIKDSINLELEKMEYKKMAIKSTQKDNIKIEINSLFYLEAPVQEGQTIGSMKISIGDETIKVLKIYSRSEIVKKNVTDYLLKFLDCLANS